MNRKELEELINSSTIFTNLERIIEIIEQYEKHSESKKIEKHTFKRLKGDKND